MSGLYGVVPLRMERIIFDIERFDLLVGDLFAFLVLSGVDVAGDSEARACGGCGNELDDDLVRDKGLPRQFWVMKANMRCSMRFHLLVPGG